MANPASPPINLLAARGEFGLGAGGGGLLDLRRVPNGVVPNIAPNAGVPFGTPISLLQLLGSTSASPIVINLVGGTITGLTISPADATAGVNLTSSGNQQDNINGSTTTTNSWVSGDSPANYDVFATLNSGALTSGTTGAWLNLGTTRAWAVQRTSNVGGTNSANITLQLRPAGGGATITSAIFQLNATVDV